MGNSESKTPPKQQRIQAFVEGLEKDDIPESNDTSVDLTDGKPGQEERQSLLTGAASRSDPKILRAAYTRSHSVVDAADSAALLVDPAHVQYPFENIIMEGGGNKGLAYVGAIKCMEELGLMCQIKRIGGTSAGAITAALVAVGYSSQKVLEFLSQDIESVFMDHSCGYFSLLPNLVRKFGWNPGNKIHEWFGEAIQEKTGNPDTTFSDLYHDRGVELCIVVTNLNLMTAEYCHAKTTPNMPIRDALRMTMAIPGVFSAMPYDNHGVTDIFVDGGVLVNFPINCFDGWYLSMAKKDAFLTKLTSLGDFPEMMSQCNRFKPTGPNKTIGFLLFADSEREIMRFNLEQRYGSLMPEKPRQDTLLWLTKQEKKKDQEIAQKSHSRIVRAVNNFLKVLTKHNIEDQDVISREELKSALEDEEFLPKYREILFGKDVTLNSAFEILDADGNDKIIFSELIQFIEERGIRMQVRFQGYNRREVNSLPSFVMALQETLLTNLKYNAVKKEDSGRTVGINTGHVGTMDYNLEEADRDFIVERGYNATMSFLRYYAAERPDEVKDRDVPVSVHAQQPESIRSSKIGQSTHPDDGQSTHPVDGQSTHPVDDKDIVLEGTGKDL